MIKMSNKKLNKLFNIQGHLSDELLSDVPEFVYDQTDLIKINKHIEECETCKKKYEANINAHQRLLKISNQIEVEISSLSSDRISDSKERIMKLIREEAKVRPNLILQGKESDNLLVKIKGMLNSRSKAFYFRAASYAASIFIIISSIIIFNTSPDDFRFTATDNTANKNATQDYGSTYFSEPELASDGNINDFNDTAQGKGEADNTFESLSTRFSYGFFYNSNESPEFISKYIEITSKTQVVSESENSRFKFFGVYCIESQKVKEFSEEIKNILSTEKYLYNIEVLSSDYSKNLLEYTGERFDSLFVYEGYSIVVLLIGR